MVPVRREAVGRSAPSVVRPRVLTYVGVIVCGFYQAVFCTVRQGLSAPRALGAGELLVGLGLIALGGVAGFMWRQRFRGHHRRGPKKARGEALWEALPVGALLVDERSGRIVDCNPAALRMIERDRTEVLGCREQDLFQPVASDADMFIGSHPHKSIARYELVGRDGSRKPVMKSDMPLGTDGTCVRFETFFPLSKRQHLDDEKIVSTRRFRTYFEHLPEYCYMVSPEGTIVEANPAALSILGRNRDEVVGGEVVELYAPELREKARGLFRTWVRTGGLSNEEMVVVDGEGKRRTVLLSVSTIRDSKGEILHFVSMQRDITERRRMEQRVQRLNTLLDRRVKQRTLALATVNEELEAFVYSVSHDLRAPLRSIRGFSLALVEDYGHCLPDGGKDYLSRIHRAARRMGSLIDHLLALSRVSRQEVRWRQVDLSEQARELVDELRKASPNRHVTVSIQEGMLAACDSVLSYLVLQNLIGNAWKFTAKCESPRIEFKCDVEGSEKVFRVSDNGIGFETRHADRLFTVFLRLHTDGDYEGSGIGLATVKRVINRHGGRIWAEGQPGEGATFFFTFGETGGDAAVE